MGLLDLFFDPTRHWSDRRHAVGPIDLEAGRVAGIALGSRLEALTGFGRPDNWFPVFHSRCSWFRLGLQADLGDDGIDSFSLVFLDYLNEGFSPCTARFLKDGITIPLSHDTLQAAIVDLLGPPDDLDVDDEEAVAMWMLPDRTESWEFTLEGRLKRIDLIAE